MIKIKTLIDKVSLSRGINSAINKKNQNGVAL